MKRRIALVLSVVMLLTLFVPLQSFAADDKGLGKAITLAKTLFKIPAAYKFTYNAGTENNKVVWYLSWNSKEANGENINVRIREDGLIMDYNRYKPMDYSKKKLPKVTLKEARSKAEAFIKLVNPKALAKIRYQDNNQGAVVDYAYTLNFTRYENGVPFYNNNISVTINNQTGEIQSYYYNWTDGLVFPAVTGHLSLDKAEKAFRDQLGIWAIYNSRYEENSTVPFAVYTPKFNNYSYGIDAFTGDKIRMEGWYYDGPYFNEKVMFTRAAGAAEQKSVALTPEEQDAVKEASKLISAQDAEKIARAYQPLKLTDEMVAGTPYLSKNWPDNNQYYWYLNFNKKPQADKKNDFRYVSVTIDAKTGEITGFNISNPMDENAKVKDDLTAAKTAVEKFMTEFAPVKFKQTEYNANYEEDYRIMYSAGTADMPTSLTFKYDRLVNGIPFPNNGFNIRYDTVNSEIVEVNASWYNLNFPAVDKRLSLDKAYEKFFSQVGLELQYKTVYPEQNPKIAPIPRPDGVKPVVKLVYSLRQNKPSMMDANTGILLDYSGQPYKENKPYEYTDIAKNAAEKQIAVLGQYGIGFEGSKFRPNDAITQKDFFILFSKALNNYYGPVMKSASSDKEVEEMYNILIREGIIKQGEKNPKAYVTRLDCAKYVVRSLKLDKAADIQGIYRNPFKDGGRIASALLGYAVMADGLKLVEDKNGYFKPAEKMTRGQAAVVVYNYLQN